MLGADSVNLALMVAESGIIDTAINDVMARSQMVVMAENRGVSTSVKNHLMKWRTSVKKRITKVCETERFKTELALYQQVIHWNEAQFETEIERVVKQLEWHSAFYVKARKLLDDNKIKHNPMFPHFFCDQWYQHLKAALKQAQVSELEANKEKVLDDLYQRIETIQEMDGITSAGDEESIGRLWDMASAKLKRSDVGQLKQYADFLKKNPGLQAIATSLGRMAGEVDDPALTTLPDETLEVVEESSDEVADDIVGVHQSDDLNRLLPNETMFLTHPELEVVFYQHLIDKRLMNYRVKGKARTIRKVVAHKPDHAAGEIEKGPFILCVDASGSMKGFPEKSTKAMAYALMQIALAEGRDCFVMLFSTDQITYELTKQDGLQEMADFLSYTFYGGTDIEQALIRSMEMLQTERYRNADVLVLSDFIAPTQSEELEQRVNDLKQRHFRFHAVCVSRYGNPELTEMFDHCWHYAPSMLERFTKRH
ncbi:ATPase RavA stimulator ViaA [Vibrio sp. WXL210]|uniref:ATPase RavA stimulator ViaA n=1 Tax=Vibrio sp. WXL210 TaxID=3450709 RepID=UPI003EC72AB8